MGRTVNVPTFFVWQNVLFSVGLVPEVLPAARAARKDPATKFSGTETAEFVAKTSKRNSVFEGGEGFRTNLLLSVEELSIFDPLSECCPPPARVCCVKVGPLGDQSDMSSQKP